MAFISPDYITGTYVRRRKLVIVSLLTQSLSCSKILTNILLMVLV